MLSVRPGDFEVVSGVDTDAEFGIVFSVIVRGFTSSGPADCVKSSVKATGAELDFPTEGYFDKDSETFYR